MRYLASLLLVFAAFIPANADFFTSWISNANYMYGSANPSTTATNAPIGTIYFNSGGSIFTKQDDGYSTNWAQIAGAANFSIGAFGSTPNANGLSLSSNVLTMQPADGTHPGGITSGAQTIGGVKTLSSAPILSALTASQVVATNSSKALISVAYTPANTASAIVQRDSQGNSINNNSVSAANVTVTSGQVINMTSGSARIQKTTGTSTATFNLPDATTLTPQGWTFEFNNNSTGSVTVNLHDGSTLNATVPAGGYAYVICTDNTTSNGVFDVHVMGPSSATWGTNAFIPVGLVEVPSGTVSAPGLTFSAETNSGFYRKGSHDIGMTVNGILGMESILSTTPVGGFINYSFGGSASTTDSVPILVHRAQDSSNVQVQVDNASTATNSFGGFLATSNNAANSAQFGVYGSSTVTGYNNSLVIRNTGSTTNTSIFGGTATSTVQIWTNGDYTGGLTAQFNADQSTTLKGLLQLPVQGSGTTPTCGAGQDGSLALTNGHKLCVCVGGSSAWKNASDGSTACTF